MTEKTRMQSERIAGMNKKIIVEHEAEQCEKEEIPEDFSNENCKAARWGQQAAQRLPVDHHFLF
ncbi:MAG: hypothetical protein A2487_06560 [Candidatus Raymondbacteria bacterium RifOxyC12_full_50_8]|uniref:Uncharacterized protein n=1 Tax=Candidatus Raymondbacteria bacterium RIFOXYD12_FULL_49_13 TaxID=1817890 RepID=A0A1F7FHZ8_UNCRA|nr:MAG: hypothetical protein A2248_21275 [Candidatus Raymondbacteria bacterium RIFOXYA2_FULL_49_16]OGK02151.1 MAG: hypothetical protein A2350_20140 [Candidatus Raymondbacteria bacterium RifOxyB12_full_50_8]OGK05962.1 MAG: hypothetical protein A2487_06560 [Candidatus Raymondbacteria bacterium RifOxyC12_full_50_8]OGK06320.1 MAG: hypothetical protein A2519_08590 [Candidatus Raymondbacteria bacterium RIFOXYD12_FULL_49_13]OGP40653.1 MAG: hypothetical protein A2324_03345 [Candidatus Raymondbacteria b